jgi:acetyltransferase-like isoleucine patch superfamily enzyme
VISSHAHVDPAAKVGARCEIAAGAVVGAQVRLGDNVHIGAGALLLGPCSVGNDSVIGVGCILDASADNATQAGLVLESHVQLLAGVTIAARITVASGARIQAGAVVQRSVPVHAVVAGNPAQIVGYTLSVGSAEMARMPVSAAREIGVSATMVRGVTLHRLPRILDLRGNLTVGEFGRSVPFAAKRYFMVFGVPNAEIRGEHAHRSCDQFLVCAHGNCSVVADDGVHREEFLLDDSATGLYLPALTWGIQYKYSADAVLLVFASEDYDGAEYIRDYAEFLALTQPAAQPGS